MHYLLWCSVSRNPMTLRPDTHKNAYLHQFHLTERPIQQLLWQANDNNSEPVHLNVLFSLGTMIVLLEQSPNPAIFPILLETTSSLSSHYPPTAIKCKLNYVNHTYNTIQHAQFSEYKNTENFNSMAETSFLKLIIT